MKRINDWRTGDLFAAARKTDPDTSREAAQYVEDSGIASAQRSLCLWQVRHTPGMTSAEIGEATLLGRYPPARRLPELRRAGLVRNGESRICGVTGRRSITWFPVEADGVVGKEVDGE